MSRGDPGVWYYCRYRLPRHGARILFAVHHNRANEVVGPHNFMCLGDYTDSGARDYRDHFVDEYSEQREPGIGDNQVYAWMLRPVLASWPGVTEEQQEMYKL